MHVRAAGLLAGLVIALLAATPTQAQQPPENGPPQPEDGCEGPIRLASTAYTANGVTYQSMPSDLQAGSELRVDFRLEGCGETQLTLVSYEAEADFELTTQTIHDVQTEVFAQGDHNLTVTVPPCFFQIDFAFGAAIEQFSPPNGTYHGQGRIIAAVAGGGCGAPTVQAAVCPAELTARTEADGSIALSWNATAAAKVLYRAEGNGQLQPLTELGAEAEGTVDADVKAGQAYTYELVAITETSMQPCAAVQVGSVPVFPAPLAGALAVGLGIGGYAMLRRRS